MKISHKVIALTLLGFAGITARAATVNFASVGQTNGSTQFTILNSGGTVSTTATGLDYFTFFVSGTPFGNAPVLANFLLTSTSTSSGACGSDTCPTGDSFTEQGFTGTFSYIVAGGSYAGDVLLAGTFNTNGTPTNSGAKLSASVNGHGGSFAASDSPSNLNGIQMTSDFLSFAGVTFETGGWTFSALDPAFLVDPTLTKITFPKTGTTYLASNSATFSYETSQVPEPASALLFGSALVGLGLIGRKKLTR